MPLTSKQKTAIHHVEKALDDALEHLNANSADSDEAAAGQVLRDAARMLRTHLPEVRAR